jgi:hypothetical protein
MLVAHCCAFVSAVFSLFMGSLAIFASAIALFALFIYLLFAHMVPVVIFPGIARWVQGYVFGYVAAVFALFMGSLAILASGAALFALFICLIALIIPVIVVPYLAVPVSGYVEKSVNGGSVLSTSSQHEHTLITADQHDHRVTRCRSQFRAGRPGFHDHWKA